jgi:pantetheine-phosphate adenylyltransferase
MNNIVVGGTFNKLHKGHKSLLKNAFSIAGDGGFVSIGVTTDEYTSKNKKYFVPYDIRVLRIKKYLESEMCDNYRIMPLDDMYGDSTTNDNYSAIMVSPETVEGAEKINAIRKENGLKELYIYKSEHVLDEDGEVISSSRIMNGEIDESGRYRNKMKVTILGTSGGMSSAIRASAGYMVQYKNASILLDCGDLTSRQMQLARINVNEIDAIFISHNHIDHYIGLPMLVLHHMMMFGRKKPLDIYCPEEVSVSLAIMFNAYPIASPFQINFNEIPYGVNVNGLQVTPFVVDHGITDAYGFKVTNERGKSVVYSGDTKPCNSTESVSECADLLIHEATFASDWTKEVHGHSTVKEAIALAERAKVHKLILTHISLKYHGNIAETYAKDIEPAKFRIIIGEDLDVIEV